MDSEKVQSTAVMVSTAESIGTGLLIECRSKEFDYVITARHNIKKVAAGQISILDCRGNPIEILNIAYLRDTGPDIAILRVPKAGGANRIPICSDEENHAMAVLAGYPGALQSRQNKHLELKGEISYSAAELTDFYFQIFNAPDPGKYKEEYITGFSGGGIFQLTSDSAKVTLKGIVIQRWEQDFDVKRTRCIKISVVTGILDEEGLPPFAGIHVDLTRFVERMPLLFNPDLATLIKRSTHIMRLASTGVADIFNAENLSLPQLEGLYTRLIKLPFRVQDRLLGETFYAKSIAYAYYFKNADKIDFCDNPLQHEDELKIMLCYTQNHIDMSAIVCHLAGESHREYLDKCLVIVCSFEHGNPKVRFGVNSNQTGAIVRNYTRATVDRDTMAEAASYLDAEVPTRGFSVYPITALSPLIDSSLHALQFEADNSRAYLIDENFLKAIKDTLDGTIKSG